MKYAKPGWDKGPALHMAAPTKPAQQLENQYNKIQRCHLKKAKHSHSGMYQQ